MVLKKSQMRIQQMAFMIVAVFLFFILVALFLLQIFLGELQGGVHLREREQAISLLESISQTPEFSCSDQSSFCIDEDKILAFKIPEINKVYSDFWPVASIKIYKVGKDFSSLIECPAINCNYYKIYEDENQMQKQEVSSYVVVCKKMKDNEGYVYDFCELAKLSIGIKIRS
ncbi:MAG: hypothetical protein QXX68_03045 [Candidatus Pacearchaeota archaeon]